MHKIIQRLRRQWFALIAAAVALLGTLFTWPVSQRFPFALFIAAVMVSAWRGGLKPGLVTTGASALALLLLFVLFPDVRAAEAGEHFVLRLLMFLLIGVLAGYLSMKCKEAVVAHDRFHDAIAGMGESLIFTDARGHITFLNATAQTLTGLAPADAEGKIFGETIALLHEDSRQPLEDPAAWALRANTPAALPDGTILRSITNFETPVEGAALPLRDADERIVGVAVAFHSASARRAKEQELRQRESRFRSALGSAPAALLLLDAHGHCLFTNRACQVLGGFSFDEGLGQGWTRCIHLDDRDRLLIEWSAAFQAGTGTFRGDFRLQGDGDEPRRVRLQATTMISDYGQTIGQIATIEDLTDLINAENMRQEIEDRAERAEAARRASEEHAASAGQRQKKFEESLGQLREELQRQVQAHAEAQRHAEEKRSALVSAKQQAEHAREELARRLEESDKARRHAEETLNGSQMEFARLMDEHLAAQRTAEETLKQLREEHALQLASHGQRTDRAELEKHAAARREAEEALHAAKQRHAKEIDQLSNDSLTELGALEDKLRQSRQSEETARKENEELRRTLETHNAQLHGTHQHLAAAREQVETLTRENELLAEALKPATESKLPPPIEPNGYVDPAPHPPAMARRPAETSDWLSFN